MLQDLNLVSSHIKSRRFEIRISTKKVHLVKDPAPKEETEFEFEGGVPVNRKKGVEQAAEGWKLGSRNDIGVKVDATHYEYEPAMGNDEENGKIDAAGVPFSTRGGCFITRDIAMSLSDPAELGIVQVVNQPRQLDPLHFKQLLIDTVLRRPECRFELLPPKPRSEVDRVHFIDRRRTDLVLPKVRMKEGIVVTPFRRLEAWGDAFGVKIRPEEELKRERDEMNNRASLIPRLYSGLGLKSKKEKKVDEHDRRAMERLLGEKEREIERAVAEGIINDACILEERVLRARYKEDKMRVDRERKGMEDADDSSRTFMRHIKEEKMREEEKKRQEEEERREEEKVLMDREIESMRIEDRISDASRQLEKESVNAESEEEFGIRRCQTLNDVLNIENLHSLQKIAKHNMFGNDITIGKDKRRPSNFFETCIDQLNIILGRGQNKKKTNTINKLKIDEQGERDADIIERSLSNPHISSDHFIKIFSKDEKKNNRKAQGRKINFFSRQDKKEKKNTPFGKEATAPEAPSASSDASPLLPKREFGIDKNPPTQIKQVHPHIGSEANSSTDGGNQQHVENVAKVSNKPKRIFDDPKHLSPLHRVIGEASAPLKVKIGRRMSRTGAFTESHASDCQHDEMKYTPFL